MNNAAANSLIESVALAIEQALCTLLFLILNVDDVDLDDIAGLLGLLLIGLQIRCLCTASVLHVIDIDGFRDSE